MNPYEMNPNEIGLRDHSALLALAAVALCAALIIRDLRIVSRLRQSLGIINPQTRMFRAIFAVAVSLALCVALARPYWGTEKIKTTNRGTDVIFLVDISRSMYAADLPPSRIELAKRKMIDLVTSLSMAGAARFGITVFSGDGYTVCPLTTDRGVLKQFIEIISPELVTTLGSNLAAGLETALGRLDDNAKKHTRVILISDGEDNFINYSTLAKEISAKGVRIDTLGVGTPDGAGIILPNGQQVTDSSRSPVISTLHEDSLKEIAKSGAGVYTRVSLDDSDIAALTAPQGLNLTSPETRQTELTTFREFGSWIALLVLLALIVSALSPKTNPLLVALFVQLSPLSNAWAQSDVVAPLMKSNDSAYQAYQRGDYDTASELYRKALNNSPNDRNLSHGLASSLYKKGQYQESYQIFHKLAQEAQDGRDYFESAYNEANALLQLKRYNDAIDSYSRALDIKPDDQMALHNREVARALLEQEQQAKLKTTPTPTPTPSPTPSPTARQQGSPQPTSSPEPTPPDQQQQQSTPSPASTPSPDPQHSPSQEKEEDGQSTPQPTVEASPSAQITVAATVTAAATVQGSPSPSERLKEALEPSPSPAAQDYASTTTTSPTPDDNTALPETNAWLESLPDSPLLVRRHRGSNQNNGQTW